MFKLPSNTRSSHPAISNFKDQSFSFFFHDASDEYQCLPSHRSNRAIQRGEAQHHATIKEPLRSLDVIAFILPEPEEKDKVYLVIDDISGTASH
mmetsp:Transcript_4516/g.7599  ORF Transcript_4516/g.7599 Transcript_4516/m.7599 type:complete len:94 (+) Transcript_4516:1156-1437(+)